jgi:hypothetical protein
VRPHRDRRMSVPTTMIRLDCVIQRLQPEQPRNRLVGSGPARLPEHDMLFGQEGAGGGSNGVARQQATNTEPRVPTMSVPAGCQPAGRFCLSPACDQVTKQQLEGCAPPVRLQWAGRAPRCCSWAAAPRSCSTTPAPQRSSPSSTRAQTPVRHPPMPGPATQSRAWATCCMSDSATRCLAWATCCMSDSATRCPAWATCCVSDSATRCLAWATCCMSDSATRCLAWATCCPWTWGPAWHAPAVVVRHVTMHSPAPARGVTFTGRTLCLRAAQHHRQPMQAIIGAGLHTQTLVCLADSCRCSASPRHGPACWLSFQHTTLSAATVYREGGGHITSSANLWWSSVPSFLPPTSLAARVILPVPRSPPAP